MYAHIFRTYCTHYCVLTTSLMNSLKFLQLPAWERSTLTKLSSFLDLPLASWRCGRLKIFKPTHSLDYTSPNTNFISQIKLKKNKKNKRKKKRKKNRVRASHFVTGLLLRSSLSTCCPPGLAGSCCPPGHVGDRSTYRPHMWSYSHYQLLRPVIPDPPT